MKALSITAPRQMDVVETDVPSVDADHVLVKVAYCGICGSDFPRYFDGAVHSFPQTLGHEFSGEVALVGDRVEHLSAGQRVVAAPLVPCGTCEQCERGRPALCSQYSFVGSRQQGALAQYVSVPVRNVVPVPDSVSLRDAALVEPLSIALHGIDRAPMRSGVTAAVFGAGVIGLLSVMVLKARGASRVIAIDVHQDKLDLARSLGADETVLAVDGGTGRHFAEHGLPELCIETAGHPSTQVDAMTYCAKGGHVVYVGTSTREITFAPAAFEKMLRRELVVTGSWMSYSAPFPGYEWSTAVEMIASGAVQTAPLISRVYGLDDGAAPFEDVRDSKGRFLKVLYRPNEDLS